MTASSELKGLARTLEEAGCKVLWPFEARQAYGAAAAGQQTTACFVDVETTGVTPEDDVIEVGLVRVEFDPATFELGRVVERYEGLEDPGRPLPAHIAKLTKLTDAMLLGKRFDEEAIQALVKRSAVVIAHNANFDRPMCEKRFPWMAKRPWACSMSDIPWRECGLSSTKLEFIAVSRGLHYTGHRALMDAEVTAAVCGMQLQDGLPAFAWAIEQAKGDWTRVWATDAPFERRSVLKEAGYEWCDGSKTEHKGWRCHTLDAMAELEFLDKEIYGGRGVVLTQKLSRNDRFSERYQSQEWVKFGSRKAAARALVDAAN